MSFTNTSCQMFLSDRRQSYGFCQLQCLGWGGLHTGGFCLQDAGWNDFSGGSSFLPELCGGLYDAIWGCQPARRDVSVGPLGRRWSSKSFLVGIFFKKKLSPDIAISNVSPNWPCKLTWRRYFTCLLWVHDWISFNQLVFQGQAVAQLCATVPKVTVFGIASCFKHSAIKDSVTHLFDRNIDFMQEVKK